MKKTILAVVLVMITSAGFAQDLGIKAGATYATFRGDDAEQFDHRTGYTAGVMLQKHSTDLFGVQLEALYTSRGAKVKYRSGNNNIEEKFRLNYVDVPVLLHISSGGLFADLGPQVSFISKARQIREVTPNSGNSTTIVKTDVTDNPYTIDFSYVAGIGYRSSNNVGLELRYTGGLKKIDDEGPAVGNDRFNSTFSLMLSYFL